MRHRHQGLSLLLILPLLAMLTLAVVSASRSVIAEQRLLMHLQERQRLQQLAEQALQQAEWQVWQNDSKQKQALWQGSDTERLTQLNPCGNSQELPLFPLPPRSHCQEGVSRQAAVWSNPHYLVELLDSQFNYPWLQEPGRLYRLSIRVWGKSSRQQRTRQSWLLIGKARTENVLPTTQYWRLGSQELTE